MPSRTVPDRVAWAVDRLDLVPNAPVLEIGGGPGAAAELVCRRLERGFLLGIDRSAVVVARSTERNRAHIEAGRLELRQVALSGLEIPEGSFDVAFSVNVNVFWTRSTRTELALLRRALRPGGRLHIMFGPAPGDPSEALATVRRHIEDSPFGWAEVHQEDRGSEVRTTKQS